MGDVKVQVVVLVEVGVVMMMMMTITLTQCQEYTAMTRSEWSIIIAAVDPLVAKVMKEGTTRNIMTNVGILPKRRRRGLRRSIIVVVQATQEEEEAGNPTHPKMIPLVTSVVVRVP